MRHQVVQREVRLLEQPQAQKYGILHLATHRRELLLLDEAIHQATRHQAMEAQLPVLVKTDGMKPPKQREILLGMEVDGLRLLEQIEVEILLVKHRLLEPVKENHGGMKHQLVRWVEALQF
uniref:Splicing factor 3b subunit 1 n=1 Tax=Cercocebus atys TaxID=9531 RepID=A0A2K5MHD5_CERAT